MIKQYTGMEWLMIDLASRFGHDKILNQERIEWSIELLPLFKVDSLLELRANLAPWIESADEPAAFTGCALAIWDTWLGRTSNWMVSQDAASSGPQLMSLMGRCEVGMSHTGTMQDGVPDFYNSVSGFMSEGGLDIARKVLKQGMIPHMYASTVAPQAVFGDDYPLFMKSYAATVPFAQALSNALVSAWNPSANEHTTILPDGFEVVIPVLVQEEKKIPFFTHTYSYRYSKVGTKKKSRSLPANVVHGYDAYVLRELNRRCNYSKVQVETALYNLRNPKLVYSDKCVSLKGLEKLSKRFNQISVVALEYICPNSSNVVSEAYKETLINTLEDMLEHEPFEIKNVHDDFSCLPNHVNREKYHYNELMVETYEGTWIVETLKHLTGKIIGLPAVKPEVSARIRMSEYSIS